MLYSNLGNENSDAGHIKCSRGPHLACGRQAPTPGLVLSNKRWHSFLPACEHLRFYKTIPFLLLTEPQLVSNSFGWTDFGWNYYCSLRQLAHSSWSAVTSADKSSSRNHCRQSSFDPRWTQRRTWNCDRASMHDQCFHDVSSPCDVALGSADVWTLHFRTAPA